jgi:hypothetical protein
VEALCKMSSLKSKYPEVGRGDKRGFNELARLAARRGNIDIGLDFLIQE